LQRMVKKLEEYTKEELLAYIGKLKKDIKFGLVWNPKDEQVVIDCDTKVPVLQEVTERTITKAGTDEPTHLLLEGDNYHSLSVLNYTHAGKVDVVYIDPPYNTGNKDFIYNDHFVNREDPYRHSEWLSFMDNRLRLAKNLMADTGVIFISIDDNEQAHLKILCDTIFGEENFITMFIWEKTQHFGRQKVNFYNNSEYILCYAKKLFDNGNLRELLIEYTKTEFEDAPLYNASNPNNVLTFPAGSTKFNMPDGVYNKSEDEKYELLDKVTVKNGKNKNAFRLKFCSRWSAQTVLDEHEKGTTYWVKTTNFAIRAIYSNGKESNESPKQTIFTNRNNEFVTKSRFGVKAGTSEDGTSELSSIVGEQNIFNYPKPTTLIEYLLSIHDKADGIVLDFFAGSGTTGHAVMDLNRIDGGKRQFILGTNNENGIAENVAYRRIKNVIETIPANLRYFKTDFVDTNGLNTLTDNDKLEITKQMGDMIALRENSFNQVEQTDHWQTYENGTQVTAIYFREDKTHIQSYLDKLNAQDKPVKLYIFGWGKNAGAEYSTRKISVEDIPEPLIEVYKELAK